MKLPASRPFPDRRTFYAILFAKIMPIQVFCCEKKKKRIYHPKYILFSVLDMFKTGKLIKYSRSTQSK